MTDGPVDRVFKGQSFHPFLIYFFLCSGPGLPAPAAGEVSALLAAAGDALVDPHPLIQLVPSDDDCAPLSKHKAIGISKDRVYGWCCYSTQLKLFNCSPVFTLKQLSALKAALAPSSLSPAHTKGESHRSHDVQ